VITAEGFRTRTVLIATTLTEASLYPADAIRELYAQRWNIELHFAQIKTTLQIDVLRCQKKGTGMNGIKISEV
jgi:IS4 transposase